MTGTKRIENIISKDDYINKDLIFILTYKYKVDSNNLDQFKLLCEVFNWLKKNVDLKIIDNKIIVGDTELEIINYDEGDIFQFAKLVK